MTFYSIITSQVRIPHKFADVSTIITFIKGWSAAALTGEVNAGIEISPLDTATEQFPPLKELAATTPVVVFPNVKSRTRRFVLDPTKIIPLATGEVVPKPTRAEAVVAFMWRCVARASRKSDPEWRLLLSQAVNLRGRLPEPLLETTIGNLIGNFTVEVAPSAEESEMELKKLVGNMREAKRELFENLIPTLGGGEESCKRILEGASQFGTMINSTAVDFYYCSSWCKFGMYEAADFGWGRPVWISLEREGRKNNIVLVDTRDGNTVEVYLTLSQADMDALEADEELLQFASLNPSVSGLLVP